MGTKTGDFKKRRTALYRAWRDAERGARIIVAECHRLGRREHERQRAVARFTRIIVIEHERLGRERRRGRGV
jgi:hypothetical protein